MSTHQLLGLDSMVFIYYLESDSPFHASAKNIIESILSGQNTAVTSVISELEVLSPAKFITDSERVENYTLFFHSLPGLTLVDVSPTIAQTAAHLRRVYPTLRSPDAIQIASAVINKADLFITNDLKIAHLPGLPINIKLLEKY